MKIILNTIALRPPLTGIGHYTTHLAKGLKKHPLIDEVIGIPTSLNHIGENEILGRKSVLALRKVVRALPFSYDLVSYLRKKKFNQIATPLAEKNFIYHETSYILQPYEGPTVCSVHDLSHIVYPHYHPRERVKFLLRELPPSIEKAHHIITGSLHTRSELIKFFSLDPNRVTTIYHGVDESFKPRTEIDLTTVLETYGLKNQSYLLSVGTLEPRKNIRGLIQAYKQLPEMLRKRYPLVLVGINGWKTSALEKDMRSLIDKQQLYCLGYVANTDLPYLFAGSHAFAYVSFYEGFGLPLLEALACGIPVLSSNTTSVPEVVEDAGLLVDPNDISAMTQQLERLLTDTSLRIQLQQKALVQAAKFSWNRCVEETVSIYTQLMRSG